MMSKMIRFISIVALFLLIGIGLFYDPDPLKRGVTIEATIEVNGKSIQRPVDVMLQGDTAIVSFTGSKRLFRYTIPVIIDGNYIYHRPEMNRKNPSAYFSMLVTNKVQDMSLFDGKKISITYTHE